MDKFFLDRIYNIFFPIKCGYCGEITGTTSYICDNCRKDEEDRINRCKYCGTKNFNDSRICNKCQKAKIYYDEFIYFKEYKDILKNKMLEYKFYDKKYLKNFFAEELSKILVNIEVDYVTGVPITKQRMMERGYNQTNLIANRVGKILDIEYVPDLIVKTKNTEHQSKLTKEERKNNVKDSFRIADKYNILDKKILLIDDIFTTGATVNECSKILKKSNAKKVIVATILCKK